MTEYESDVGRETGAEIQNAAEGADRILQKYGFETRLAMGFAVTMLAGYALQALVHNQAAAVFGAIAVYFSAMFAAIAVLVGLAVKAWGVVRRSRSGA